ncbi:MAG: 16S rRNA (adenine(1518)-N(6)/adenine(1519)-N(6))-dimethyltransferase, partial [Gammaproteobacteria bacterium]|nr:16S rRNA (adenine(1518)-N(6)/adenine(1519)-N(6))-dimethyltransferase [Gammaproteobacteria bacterium]
QLVRQAFSMRRKTIRNTLKKTCSIDDLEAVNINPSHRPENITPEQYYRLCNYINNKIQESS